jgi:uncharacterized SAM-binding protein YcdF (DUF218 family)
MTIQVRGMIIVLGSPNSETGQLSSIAKERCELALAEFAKRPNWKFLLTGGYGAHFNITDQPHAAYLKRYLVSRGIPTQEIVDFVESTNTLQDASFSKPIVLKYGASEIVVVTSDYHVERARYIFEREFAGTGIHIDLLASRTAEAACEFYLDAQKKHEKQALAKLKKSDKQV